ncbi:MAG: SAM-dependent methyltransferase [Pirellulaceae bacterium]
MNFKHRIPRHEPQSMGDLRLHNYQLIDFGNGRKLEAIDDYLIDRPCPAADWDAPLETEAWQRADAVFDDSRWTFFRPWPTSLRLAAGGIQLSAEATPFGHIGFFPEQADNWRWLANLRDIANGDSGEAMNLFAYTGGSTLSLAEAGFRVAHVDASKPSVARAGENARTSGLGDAAIRYLIEDAPRFAARERRRQRTYHVIVLDPPAYGHGTRNATWRLERDLWPLLDDCLALLNERAAMLITGHSDTLTDDDIVGWLRRQKPHGMEVAHGRSVIRDRSGRSLDAGYFVRVTWNLGKQ